MAHPLGRWFSNLLTPYLSVFSTTPLQKQTWFYGKILGLDVAALFKNVPLDEALNCLVDQFNSGILHWHFPIDSFVSIGRLCDNDYYFVINYYYSFHRKIFGVAIGSPLSPVFADLYMKYFESCLLSTLNSRLVLLLRYVDDSCALWPNDANFDYPHWTKFLVS